MNGRKAKQLGSCKCASPVTIPGMAIKPLTIGPETCTSSSG